MPYRIRGTKKSVAHPVVTQLDLAERLEISEQTIREGVVIIGDPGAEVSQRAVFPIVRRLIDAGHGGLIIDDSGEVGPRLEALYAANVITVGPTSRTRINLLAKSTDASLRAFVRTWRMAYEYMSKNEDANSNYWGSVVENDVPLLAKVIRQLESRDVTLVDVYRLGEDERYIAGLVDKLEAVRPTLARELRSQVPYSAWVNSSMTSSAMDNNRAWHYAFVRTALAQLWYSPFLRGAFCDTTVPEVAIPENAIVVLDMPRTEWGDAVDFVSSALAPWYYRRNREGFLVTTGVSVEFSLQQVGRRYVVAAVNTIKDRDIAAFGAALLFGTTRPTILSWVAAVLGESTARRLALSARPGEGYALMRRSPSAAGLMSHGEFHLDQDPLWSIASLGLRQDIHRRMAQISRAPSAS